MHETSWFSCKYHLFACFIPICLFVLFWFLSLYDCLFDMFDSVCFACLLIVCSSWLFYNIVCLVGFCFLKFNLYVYL